MNKLSTCIGALSLGLILQVNNANAAWWSRFVPQHQNPPATPNQQYPAFNDAQVKDVQKIIENYLMTNPEILIKVSESLKNKMAQQAQVDAQQAIKNNAKDLFNDPNSPVAGNSQGDVTLVEFFDYQCGHCKNASNTVEQLITNNPNLKVVYKELPIFGGSSLLAAQYALAANLNNNYKAMHDALFNSPGKLSTTSIQAIATAIGLNYDKLTAAQKQQIQDELNQNKTLAQNLKLNGTPAFIIANQDYSQFSFIPGAVPMPALQQAIDKAKQSNATGANNVTPTQPSTGPGPAAPQPAPTPAAPAAAPSPSASGPSAPAQPPPGK